MHLFISEGLVCTPVPHLHFCSTRAQKWGKAGEDKVVREINTQLKNWTCKFVTTGQTGAVGMLFHDLYIYSKYRR